MKVKRFLVFLLAAVAAGTFAAVPAGAALLSVEAIDNATVQPAGPRTGPNGKAFANVEGSNNNAFASFAVADFVFPAPGGPVTGVTGATLKLTQSNAGFSLAGPVSIYLTDQTGVDIQPTNTSLNYVSGMNGAASVDSDLSPLSLVGTGTYNVVANGAVDSYALSFGGGALTSLLNAINGGTTLRLVVTPDAASTAATWAGISNTTFAGPTLELTTVPEPAACMLVGFLGLMIASCPARIQWNRLS